MRNITLTSLLIWIGATVCFAQSDSPQDSKQPGSIGALQTQVAASNALANQIAGQLVVARQADDTQLAEFEALTQQLIDAVQASFDLQQKLHEVQLAEAEAKIAASRAQIKMRQSNSEDIIAQRVKMLLDVPEQFRTPLSVLEAMERCLKEKDYEAYVGLFSDEGAELLAGMLLQSMTMMGNMLGLMEATGQSPEETQQIKSIVENCNRFMRSNPTSESVAAMGKLASMLPPVLFQLGAIGPDGTPVKPPQFAPGEYAQVLRQSSGMLTDPRVFCVTMLDVVSAMEANENDNQQTVASEWKLVIDGIRATATQKSLPIDQTVCKTESVEMHLEDGRWKISQIGSDAELMEFAGATSLQPSQPSTIAPSNSPSVLPSSPQANGNGLPSMPYASAPPAESNQQSLQMLQGRWQVDVHNFAGEDQADTEPQLELVIDGQILRFVSGTEEVSSPIQIRIKNDASPVWQVELVVDPNGDAETQHGLLQVDESKLRICMANSGSAIADKDFRPQTFVPGKRVTLLECSRVQPDKTSTLSGKWETKRHLAEEKTQIVAEEKLPDWNDFLEQLPEVGTALVMFSNDSDISVQMLPVAKSVTEAASVVFVELPQRTWRKVAAPPATHFVLMKDRQLIGARTGLLTQKRLADFVELAKTWLTPHSTGVDPASLVRIDCYINPGKDNIGSQQGGIYSLTTAVVAVHEDQALLLGPDSIAGYIEKGYACVARVRDESGKPKQLPLDVMQIGPVKLIGQVDNKAKSAVSATLTLGDGQTREITLESTDYPKSVTEPLDAYDTGSAIYHIRGARGLVAVQLAPVDYLPQLFQPVLSGCFTVDRSRHPISNFASPIDWQSQTVWSIGSSIYGSNMNGPELIDVRCPTRPAPVGFTFSENGRLIGRYALGAPTDKDMTHSVFQPSTTHSVLRAALAELDDPALKSALQRTLDRSP
ncbi:hypothetical protein [Rosistilla oblonga]|uniref:SLA1 homology domain-containing protein n=1 Tax=Rosistilla oblonga TaxID=2527990 RepID=A0A518IX17_9BACT|nr:hypothetical protein [Rosistilla oblonga]QDV57631.1 hypothetical protein Mal33_36440 [Rosistilla oblonga]